MPRMIVQEGGGWRKANEGGQDTQKSHPPCNVEINTTESPG